MSVLTKRIEDAQERLVTLKDQLTDHLGSYEDSAVTDEQLAVTEELNQKIQTTEKSLDALREAEQRLAATSEPTGDGGNNQLTVRNQRPFAVPATKIRPQDYIWRSLVVQMKHHSEHGRRPMVEVLRDTYGECEATKAVLDVVTRSAVVPADTVTSGWASQLVQTSIGDFIEALIPNSVYPALAARGATFTFGRNGQINLPARNSATAISGGFVAQGAPVPVKQGQFTSISLTPKKMGVISTFTREIAEHSTPAIEGLIRQAIVDDTSVALDLILLDATAADTTRPAGLRNGVSVTAATTGGGVAALLGDLKALTSAIITGTNGNIRNPVWIMNPADVLAAKLTPAAAGGGEFPFKAELTAGTLLGYPVIQSTNVAAEFVYILDAADFVTATGDTPRFDISDQAVLHMETVPAPISTVGTAVAFPVRSLWQTDTIGIRMLLDVNWAMRRTGVVAWTSAVTWGSVP